MPPLDLKQKCSLSVITRKPRREKTKERRKTKEMTRILTIIVSLLSSDHIPNSIATELFLYNTLNKGSVRTREMEASSNCREVSNKPSDTIKLQHFPSFISAASVNFHVLYTRRLCQAETDCSQILPFANILFVPLYRNFS